MSKAQRKPKSFGKASIPGELSIEALWLRFRDRFQIPSPEQPWARYVFYTGISDVLEINRPERIKNTKFDHELEVYKQWKQLRDRLDLSEKQLTQAIVLHMEALNAGAQLLEEIDRRGHSFDPVLKEMSRFIRNEMGHPEKFPFLKPFPLPPPPPNLELCAKYHNIDPDPRDNLDDPVGFAKWYLRSVEKEKTHTQANCPGCGEPRVWVPKTDEQQKADAAKIPEQIRVLMEKISEAQIACGSCEIPDADVHRIIKEVNFNPEDFLPRELRKRAH